MIELESMAVVMPEVAGHPNRVDFRGVLTMVDVPSQGAPNGSNGHRVVLTRAAAEQALPSLIGMALDYEPSFQGHDARRKVGVITSAEIVERNVEIGGYLYAKDFPEIVAEVAKFGRRPVERRPRSLRFRPELVRRRMVASEGERLRTSLAQAAAAIHRVTAGIRKEKAPDTEPLVLRAETTGIGTATGLGMSYELTGVDVLDRTARFWTLTKVTFTGAAILRRNKAAYQNTWIELSQ